MTRTKKGKHEAKARSAIAARAKAQKQHNDPLPQKQPAPRVTLSTSAVRKQRLRRIQSVIVGPDRDFGGEIHIPDLISARLLDSHRLQDIKSMIKKGTAAVYWADGSCGGKAWKKGFLGAGVAWYEVQSECTAAYPLGRYTGNHGDAEIFAIAAALGRAKKEVEKGKKLAVVRIFSDAKGVLEGLARGKSIVPGPMIAKKTALEGLYERTDWLVAHGAAVQLEWLKGHSKSEGNRLADETADRAVEEQGVQLHRDTVSGRTKRSREAMTEADVPDMWKELGQDWVDEWLSRATLHTHQKKKARMEEDSTINCPVRESPSPMEQQLAPEDDESESEDQVSTSLPEQHDSHTTPLDATIAHLTQTRNILKCQMSHLQQTIQRTKWTKVKTYLQARLASVSIEFAQTTGALRRRVADRPAQARWLKQQRAVEDRTNNKVEDRASNAVEHQASNAVEHRPSNKAEQTWVGADLLAALYRMDNELKREMEMEAQRRPGDVQGRVQRQREDSVDGQGKEQSEGGEGPFVEWLVGFEQIECS